MHAAPPDLYELLAGAVTDDPGDGDRVAVADSKRLYKPGGGWRLLERGVLAARALLVEPGATLSESGGRFSERIDHEELLAALATDADGDSTATPWQRGDALPLPRDASPGEVADAADALASACEGARVRFLGVRARRVEPAEFNDLVDRHGTKGAALSHVTLALVREVVDDALSSASGGWGRPTGAPREDARDGAATGGSLRSSPATPCETVQITCDKHGGRNRYAGLLQHHFPDCWIDVIRESRAESRYTWRHGSVDCTATFRVGGEAALPTALASMTAKYLRELAMHEFNAYWTQRVPGLRPTAGYPVDAKRFKAEIAAEQKRLGIDDRVLWRCR
ncbi:MAG: hypothetical protein CMJ58_19925 [Planctomycetaceae bacterium]|nr:hypothetical protein [Planctomycetaceae bacterium]